MPTLHRIIPARPGPHTRNIGYRIHRSGMEISFRPSHYEHKLSDYIEAGIEM